MTDWKEQTAEELISQLKSEAERTLNLPLNSIIINPEFYHDFKGSQDTSFLGKLKWGWKLFALSFSDWQDAMIDADYVDEFFYYLGQREKL